LSDQPHHGVVCRQAAANADITAGDMSDDLYSEINSRDTQQLLKSHASARTRRPPAAAGATSTSASELLLRPSLVGRGYVVNRGRLDELS